MKTQILKEKIPKQMKNNIYLEKKNKYANFKK